MNDVLLPGVYLCVGLFIMANCLVIVIYFIYGSSQNIKIYKPKDANEETKKIKADIQADKFHEKDKKGSGGQEEMDKFYNDKANYVVGEDDVMERWNTKYTQLFYRQKIKMFTVIFFLIILGETMVLYRSQ